jgi:hypothetical protein
MCCVRGHKNWSHRHGFLKCHQELWIQRLSVIWNMQLWWCCRLLWLNTAWSGRLGTSVETTNCLCLQRQNCGFRPRSQQAYQNNGARLPDPTALRRKPLRFSRSPPRLEISRPTSYVFNQTSSLKWDFEIQIMRIINILSALLQA